MKEIKQLELEDINVKLLPNYPNKERTDPFKKHIK